jgi:O-antigen/teichoic acid export membrane protein
VQQELKQAGWQSLVYGLGNVSSALIAFLMLPIYTRRLTPDEFGTYSVMLTAMAILAVFADLGMTNAVARFYFDAVAADPGGSPRRLVATAIALSLAASGVLAGCCYWTADEIASSVFRQPAYAPLLRIVALITLFRGLATVPMIILRVTGRAVTYALANVGQTATFLVLTLVFVSTLDLRVEGALYGYVGGYLLLAGVGLASVASQLRSRPQAETARDLLRFGLPFLPVLVLTWVVDFSDRYLLERLTSSREVGLYSLGYRFGQVMSLAVTAFTMSWAATRFQILSRSDARQVYARIASVYIALAGGLCLAVSVVSPWIIRAISGPEYHDASSYVLPVALAYLLYGLFVLAVTGLGVTKQTGGIVAVSGAAALVNVVLNLTLLPIWGAIAAAWSTAVSYLVMAGGGLVLSQRHYWIPYEYRTWGLLFGAIVACATVTTLTAGSPPALSALAGAASISAYAAAALLSGAIPASALAGLVGMGRRIVGRRDAPSSTPNQP